MGRWPRGSAWTGELGAIFRLQRHHRLFLQQPLPLSDSNPVSAWDLGLWEIKGGKPHSLEVARERTWGWFCLGRITASPGNRVLGEVLT